MQHEVHKQNLARIKNGIILDIVGNIKLAKAFEIELDIQPIHKFIDDQFNEVIGRINVEGETPYAVIDDQHNGYNVNLKDISTDMLLVILEELECERFEIFEANGE